MVATRVVLASNGELWWEGLFLLLEKRDDFKPEAICYTAEETLAKTSQLKPDVLLLDEELAEIDCGDIVARVNELQVATSIIIVLKPFKTVSLASSFKGSARAYINKDITLDELLQAIRQVARGGVVVISPLIAQQLLERVAASVRNRAMWADQDIGLSKREKEILTLLLERGRQTRRLPRLCS